MSDLRYESAGQKQAREQAADSAAVKAAAEMAAIRTQLKTQEEEANKQKQLDRIRFWVTTTIALIGSLAAIGSLIATIVLN